MVAGDSNPLTDLMRFCEDVDFVPESPDIEDFVGELEDLLANGSLSESNSNRLQTMLETFKKMIFKMLDKTKKTIVAKDPDEDDMEESVRDRVGHLVEAKKPRKLGKRQLDKAIEQTYYKHGRNIQISMMKIPAIFRAAKEAYKTGGLEAMEDSVKASIAKYRVA